MLALRYMEYISSNLFGFFVFCNIVGTIALLGILIFKTISKIINPRAVYLKFIGSYATFVVGVLLLLIGIGHPSSIIPGWYMVIGSVAYMSAKERKLGLVKEYIGKNMWEILGIVAITISTVTTNWRILYNDPFPNLIIPIWAIIAYSIICFKQNKYIE